MSDIEARLLAACREIADCVLHNYDKAELIDEIWSTDDREKLAKAYFDEAKWSLSHVKESGYDPELVIRAVSYLGAMASRRCATGLIGSERALAHCYSLHVRMSASRLKGSRSLTI